MDDRTVPPPTPCTLIRTCETSRLQRQLLARAYQQICPEVRCPVHEVMAGCQRLCGKAIVHQPPTPWRERDHVAV